ncbi:MAG: FtsX-like permease family protein, partial [Erysipelotrichaceae bacterium]|nr:FtsX-like permease family protein [Erysipelotrichaceae bacterium]
EQESYLRDKLVGEYEKELKKNEDLFLKEKEDGQQKLDEAKKKLDDAYLELLIGKSQLDTSRATLNASKKEVEANEHLLDANEATVNDAIRQVEERSGQSFDTVYGEIQVLYNTYIALEGQKGGDYAETMIDRFRKEKTDNEAQIASYQAERDALDPASENYETEVLRIESEIMILENRNSVLDSLIANIESTSGDDNIDALLAEMDAQVEGGVKKNYLDLTMLKDARDQIASGRRELENAKAQIAAGEESLKEGERKLAQGQRQYDDGVKEYNDGLLAFDEGIEKGESELRKAREELEALPNASWSILTRDYHYTSALYDSTISQMTSIGYALPVIFFLVAALVCLTTMTRLIDEQRSQIGIFRALGFSNRAIAFKYVSYASLAALGGSLIGIFLGQALFPTVIYRTWRLMYDLPEIRVSFPVLPLLASVLSFVLLMMGVTYFVASKTLKEMPASLMRPKAPKNTREVFLEKIPFLWKRLSFTSKITARNLIRYKSRFFMTVLGVAGCTALLVVGFGIKDSISDIIQIQYGQIFNYDYQLSFENDRHLKENLDVLKEDLNNEAVVPFMSYTTRCYLGAEEDTLNVLVIDPREGNEILGLRQRDRKSDLRFSNDGVILSEKFAINHKLKEGDSILVESADGIKREVRIAHICEFYFQHYIFMSDSYYSSVFEENVHNTSIAVRSADPESLKADTEDLQEYIATVDFSSLISQFENMIRALDIIIGVIIVTAGSLAFVVLVNLIEVNISERTREIATLKVLGFRPLEVENYLFKEILLLSVIGGFLGMPLGVVEHHFIMNVINMEMVMFGMNIKFFSFAISFVITIVFTVIVLLFTKRHLRAIRMVESLKSVE